MPPAPVLWQILTIGGVAVPVEWRERSPREAEAGSIGGFDILTATIWIWWGLRSDLAKATLLHEMVHAVIQLYAIPVPDGEDENVTSLVGGHAFAVLASNSLITIAEPPPRPEIYHNG